MAGCSGLALAVAVSASLAASGRWPAAMLSSDQFATQIDEFRHATQAPLNLKLLLPRGTSGLTRPSSTSGLRRSPRLRRRARRRTAPGQARGSPRQSLRRGRMRTHRTFVVPRSSASTSACPHPNSSDRVRATGAVSDVSSATHRGRSDLARRPRVRCRHRPRGRGRRTPWDVPHRGRRRAAGNDGARAARGRRRPRWPVIAAGRHRRWSRHRLPRSAPRRVRSADRHGVPACAPRRSRRRCNRRAASRREASTTRC